MYSEPPPLETFLLNGLFSPLDHRLQDGRDLVHLAHRSIFYKRLSDTHVILNEGMNE